jgi:hypothetical protein
MDGTRFDRWTRRRFGAAAGGFAAFLLGPDARRDIAAKKGKKTRCRSLLQTCSPTKKENHCCSGLNCDPIHDFTGLRCCYGRQHPCNDGGVCCGNTVCLPVDGLVGKVCCGTGAAFCRSNQDCCSGLVCSGGQCVPVTSDRALKANFGSVDPTDMLRRVRELPLAAWNDARDDPGVRHIGPVAQDFAALFRVGADERHIHPLDGQGVALAAIQGLTREIEALQTEQIRLSARIAARELDRRR